MHATKPTLNKCSTFCGMTNLQLLMNSHAIWHCEDYHSRLLDKKSAFTSEKPLLKQPLSSSSDVLHKIQACYFRLWNEYLKQQAWHCVMQGRIKYSSSAAEIEDTCAALLRQGITETGWDIEWRTTYKTGEAPRKTALMQLCYQLPKGSYCCLLFHVFFSGLPPSLRQLLEDPVPLSMICPPNRPTWLDHNRLSMHALRVFTVLSSCR